MIRYLIIIGILCTAVAAKAQASANSTIFGVTKVDIPPAGGFNLVGFNYESDQPLSLEDVFGTNQLTQSTLLPTLADRLYLWNGSSYDIFFQKTDGLFYDGKDPFGSSVTTNIQAGTAIFIQSPQGSSETNSIYFSGDVVTDTSVQQNYDSLVMFANPYPTDMDLNSTNLDWSAATSGMLNTLADRVYIWNPDGAGYDQYFLYTDGEWYQPGIPPVPGNPVIPVGGGAFYQAKGSFSNEIVRPFDF